MSKEKRRKELEEEMKKLQRKLQNLSDEYEDVADDESDEEFMKDFDPFGKKAESRPNPRIVIKPSPPMPPMPPMPANPDRIVYRHRELSPEEQKRIELQKAKIKEEKARIAEEISKLREDLHHKKENFSDLQRELRDKERIIRDKERELRARRINIDSYSWDSELDDEIEVVTKDLEMRLGDYTKSILASVAESLKSSMGMAVQGAGELGKGIKIAGSELEKIGKEISDKIKDTNVSVNFGPSIPEEKLEEFYEIGANIVAAIGDSNRLRILKELEKGPMYQKELSDITNLRGGTFKHHMDKLLEDAVKFVTQEVVRGRYFLTTRGREALKLAEMQYIRYLEDFEIEKKKGKSSSDEEYDVDIK